MSGTYDILRDNWRFLADGALITVELCGLAIVLSLLVGILLGVARQYGGRVVYSVLGLPIDVMRSIPLLVIMVWVYFALPFLSDGLQLSTFTAALVALIAHESAYFAEIVRAGLSSVRQGQLRAALALGMSSRKGITRVVLPQACIRMLPPLGSQIVIVIKDSAIASTIAVPELLRQSQLLAGQTYKPFPIYTAVMIIYFLGAFVVGRSVERLYKRLAPLGAS